MWHPNYGPTVCKKPTVCKNLCRAYGTRSFCSHFTQHFRAGLSWGARYASWFDAIHSSSSTLASLHTQVKVVVYAGTLATRAGLMWIHSTSSTLAEFSHTHFSRAAGRVIQIWGFSRCKRRRRRLRVARHFSGGKEMRRRRYHSAEGGLRGQCGIPLTKQVPPVAELFKTTFTVGVFREEVH